VTGIELRQGLGLNTVKGVFPFGGFFGGGGGVGGGGGGGGGGVAEFGRGHKFQHLNSADGGAPFLLVPKK